MVTMSDADPSMKRLADYTPPAFLVDHINLRFQLRQGQTTVIARSRLRRNLDAGDARAPLVLDGQDMELASVALDGRSLATAEYRLESESLVIASVPNDFDLEVITQIRPEDNTRLEGLYVSNGMYCTQCEAEGFRRITYFPDRPDVMARYRVRIEADRANYPVLLSNGNPVEQGDLEEGRHYAVWEDPFPKPSYLFALVAGDLDCLRDAHTTPSGRIVDLRIYAESADLAKCRHAMDSLKHAMIWDEQRYGREYDLDIYMIVAVGHFNMGAMENKGLNLFNTKYVLADRDTATDRDFRGVEGVIAHEYFHNWTGNRITCRDWFQLSLKEGLTVFRDQEFSADQGSRGVQRIDDVNVLRGHQFPEDAGPMAHPVRPDGYMEINNFYTVTIYNKGAEVVRMQRLLLGDQGFRKATDLYFERYDGQAVTTDDFVACMEDASGRNLGQFRRWYSQAGTPVVRAESGRDERGGYVLTLSQRCPPTPGQDHKQPFHIPVAVGWVGPDGADVSLDAGGATTCVLELTEAVQTFRFPNIPDGSLPSLLRGFSAPVKMEYAYRDADLAFLMAHDSDDFNRWEAGQKLATQVILGMVEQRARGTDMEVPERYLDAFGAALADRETDPELLGAVLTLPGIAQLGEAMETIDIDGLCTARETLRRRIHERHGEVLSDRYRDLEDGGPFRMDGEAVARRALRNTCLAYLTAGRDAAGLALLLDQYHRAGNMTARLAALALLAEREEEQAEEVLRDFQEAWKHDALVMDKWFSLQATADRPDALARVRTLMRHPDFILINPNRVRALIGAFAAGNLRHFHAADGSGYRFLADRILELDPLNPQVAARMASPFTRWRRYDAARRAGMKTQLERLRDRGDALSGDVAELVLKSLAE